MKNEKKIRTLHLDAKTGGIIRFNSLSIINFSFVYKSYIIYLKFLIL